MVKNLGKFEDGELRLQLLNAVSRSPAGVAEIRVRNIIHGDLDHSDRARHPATLIVFEFRFSPLHVDRRVRRAEITVSFAASRGGDMLSGPEIENMALCGEFVLRPDAHNPGQFMPVKTITREGEIAMSGAKRSLNQSGHGESVSNAVVWQINESPQTREGIPNLIETAVVLRRHSDAEKFKMKLRVELTSSGLTFQHTAGRHLSSGDQVILIDPSGQRGNLNRVDSQNLGRLELDKLFRAEFTRQDQIKITDDPEEQRQNAIRTALGSMAGREASGDKTRVAEPQSAKPITKIRPGEYFYAELWSSDSTPAATINKAEAAFGSKFEREIGTLDGNVLKKYFPWLQEPALPSTDLNASTKPESERKKKYSLIGRQGDSPGCRTSRDLNALFSEHTLLSLTKFFNLPTEFSSFRQHDRGIWLRTTSNQGQDVAYFYQTPFYPQSFWSLVLVTRENSKIGAGVLQTDSGVDILDVLRRAEQHGLKGSHPLVILVLLFQDHVLETSKKFDEVSAKILKIDSDLLHELQAGKDHKTKPKVSEYGLLSHRIYQARMNLVELQRRREFEAQVGKTLQNDVKANPALITLVDMFTGLSASHELNVRSFPDRIESQRAVLYSLIAQQDARVQYKLARETTKDSKAMKTLAFITILLLPGTFLAALFSVPDLITFKPGEKSKIYWGITVPTTFVMIVCWWLWVRRSTSHIPGQDEEAKSGKTE